MKLTSPPHWPLSCLLVVSWGWDWRGRQRTESCGLCPRAQEVECEGCSYSAWSGPGKCLRAHTGLGAGSWVWGQRGPPEPRACIPSALRGGWLYSVPAARGAQSEDGSPQSRWTQGSHFASGKGSRELPVERLRTQIEEGLPLGRLRPRRGAGVRTGWSGDRALPKDVVLETQRPV